MEKSCENCDHEPLPIKECDRVCDGDWSGFKPKEETIEKSCDNCDDVYCDSMCDGEYSGWKPKEETIKSVTHCPTCGAECKVSGEGDTHYYEPSIDQSKLTPCTVCSKVHPDKRPDGCKGCEDNKTTMKLPELPEEWERDESRKIQSCTMSVEPKGEHFVIYIPIKKKKETETEAMELIYEALNIRTDTLYGKSCLNETLCKLKQIIKQAGV